MLNIYLQCFPCLQSRFTLIFVCRLLCEISDVLGDRKEVTGDDLDKMKYAEQVHIHVITMCCQNDTHMTTCTFTCMPIFHSSR